MRRNRIITRPGQRFAFYVFPGLLGFSAIVADR